MTPATSSPPQKDSAWQRFRRQELRFKAPLMTAYCIALSYLAFAVLLIPFGVAILITALGTHSVRIRYDDAGPFADLSGDARESLVRSAEPSSRTYDIEFTVPHTMNSPVYLYFELSGFYGAYRRYVRSRDEEQLGGHSGSGDACDPIQNLEGGDILPCGLVAWSNFNDSYALFDADSGAEIALDESREAIAWPGDYDGPLEAFVDIEPENYPNANSTDQAQYAGGGDIQGDYVSEDGHFMVWMRPTGTVRTMKPWARIDRPLFEGERLRLRVQNNYNTYGFGGAKYVYLSEDPWMGARNLVLPITLLALGGFSLLCSIFFLAVGLSGKRKWGQGITVKGRGIRGGNRTLTTRIGARE